MRRDPVIGAHLPLWDTARRRETVEPTPEAMCHADDPQTSRDAAARTRPKINAICRKVLRAFRSLGPMTDEYLEELDRFADLAPSTARCRRKDLYQAGWLEPHGTTANKRGRQMTVWRIPEAKRLAAEELSEE